VRSLLPIVVLSLGLSLPANARPTRRTCLRTCAPLIAACHDAGAKRRYCRRIVLRTCRRSGLEACQRSTTTTTPGSTTTTIESSTTTTLPIDRTVNGCNRARATDLRQETAVTVRTEGFDYAPECIRVVPGTPVTFTTTSFVTFPLVGGELGVPEPASPFGQVTTGWKATFTIFEPGVYGYYSTPWWIFRMYGAVIVEPTG